MVSVRPSARTVSSFTLRREGNAAEPRVAAAGVGGGTEVSAAPETAENARRKRNRLAAAAPEAIDPEGRDDAGRGRGRPTTEQLVPHRLVRSSSGAPSESSARVAGSLLQRLCRCRGRSTC